jgi:hypothetical protein
VNSTTITVADGVTTIIAHNFTVTLSEGSVVITPVPCDDTPDPPAPLVCESQPNWMGDGTPTVFSFEAGEGENGTGFFPSVSIGTELTLSPPGVWALLNDGDGISVALTRSPHLSSARSAMVTITSSDPNEAAVELEAVAEGSGLHANAAPGWQFVPGRSYCVSIVPAWGE